MPPEQPQPRSQVAIFDLDRTITTFGTFTPFLLGTRKAFATRALLLLRFLPHMIAYKGGAISRRDLKNKMLRAAFTNLNRDKIAEFAEEFVARTLSTGLRGPAIAAIADHKARGDFLVLATASVDFYASLFAARLGFDTCVSTATNFSDRSNAALKIIGPNCYGADKVEMVTMALTGQNGRARNQQHWTFYSDHHSDFALLEICDAAFVISPKQKTRRQAGQRGFAILDW